MSKISIVTVVYNGEKYLEKTILSIINQTYNNIEYIVIDGKSQDATLDILKKYQSYIDIMVSEKDRGLSDAMNKASKLATGDWILYLHADDTFTDNMSLQKLINKTIENPLANWITGYLRFQDSNGQVFKEDLFYEISWKRMMVRNVIRHQTTLVRLKPSVDIGFMNKYKYAMDYNYFLRLWVKYGNPLVINEHITDFRLDGNNLSSNFFGSLKDEMRVRTDFRIINNQIYMLPLDYFVYLLRYLKIVFIHNLKNKIILNKKLT